MPSNGQRTSRVRHLFFSLTATECCDPQLGTEPSKSARAELKLVLQIYVCFVRELGTAHVAEDQGRGGREGHSSKQLLHSE